MSQQITLPATVPKLVLPAYPHMTYITKLDLINIGMSIAASNLNFTSLIKQPFNYLPVPKYIIQSAN